MSATQVPIRPVARATRLRLAFGLLFLTLAGVLLAWFSAGQLRGAVLQSGVELRTLVEGEGPQITAQDGVVIEYIGSLPNGTVFESTEGRPAPLLVNQVVPGFSDALQQMQKGGRYKIRIPAAQAYGANPPPGSPIPANSDLLFDIKVLEVVKNAAALAGQGPQLPPGM